MYPPGAPSMTIFQSTHPRGVRQIPLEQLPSPKQFQSTHPRGVRQALRCLSVTASSYFNPRTLVGCDHFETRYSITFHISIHAPSWGATLLTSFSRPRKSNFNPRTLVGCDILKSIYNTLYIYFNPRTLVGCDTMTVCFWKPGTIFQSTHPRGVRPMEQIQGTSIVISIHAPSWGATGCPA